MNDRDGDHDDGGTPTRRVIFEIADDPRTEREQSAKPDPQSALKGGDAPHNKDLSCVEPRAHLGAAPSTREPALDPVKTEEQSDYVPVDIFGGPIDPSVPISYHGSGVSDAIRSIFGK